MHIHPAPLLGGHYSPGTSPSAPLSWGRDRKGTILAVLVHALFFGSVHFGWGVGGVIVTTLMGVVWGTAYVLCGRNLWIVILAHTTGHLLLVAQLYFGAVG